MKSENTAAQVKAQIINQINDLRIDAEFYGYDYPTDANLESESVENLREFLAEIDQFVLDGLKAELEYNQEIVTH